MLEWYNFYKKYILSGLTLGSSYLKNYKLSRFIDL